MYEKKIEKLNNLRECILTELTWDMYGTTINMYFNYVWDGEGDIRGNISDELIVKVSFGKVMEFHLDNSLNDVMLRDIDLISWGFSEVHEMKIENSDEYLGYYENPVVPLRHSAIYFGRGRQMDIVFSTLDTEWV